MGSLIAAEEWLLHLGQGSRAETQVAGRLLRMQILLASRTEHVLLLDTEYLRRAICQSARYGHVPSVQAACAVCGAQAPLTGWERSALATAAEREEARRVAVQGGYGDRGLYLSRCPGSDYRRDVAASPSLPRKVGD